MSLDAELDAALTAMEAAFTVGLIATWDPELVCAPPDERACGWLAVNWPQFDQFPVKERDGRMIGVLLRDDDHGERTVRDAMHPLRDGLIVAADTPIVELLPELCDHHFRLVIRRNRISGLVTQSDLLKLSVRMLVFGLVSHLEQGLRVLTVSRKPWPEWFSALPEFRRRRLTRLRQTLTDAQLDPDPIEFTEFGDLLLALADQEDLGDGHVAELDQLRQLRNATAHARTFIRSEADVRAFVNSFVLLRSWLQRTSHHLRPAP